MVYTERAETAAVSCGTSHASASAHHFGGYSKPRYKKLVAHVESHASAVSLLESGVCLRALHKSDQQQHFSMQSSGERDLCDCFHNYCQAERSLWSVFFSLPLLNGMCFRVGADSLGCFSTVRCEHQPMSKWTIIIVVK